MKKYNILLVEDDRQLADITKINFPPNVFDVQVAYDGIDALKAAADRHPDLMILDVMMPGMDGWEVLLKLKSDPKTSSIPVIMCTAKDGRGDVEKSFHYGAQSYVIKPVNFPKLLKKTAAILDIDELLNG